MKTLRLLGFVLLSMTAFCVASCGDDSSDDNGGGGGGSLTPPKYESSSALYNITDANSNYKSVEFTASGNYVITMKSGVKAPQRIAALKKFQFGFIPQHAGMTRNVVDDDIIYGTYSKNGDTYVLEGFGTIVVNGGGSGAVSLDITKNNGTKVTVGAQIQQQYKSSTKTDMLCRTWNLGKIKWVQTVNGQTVVDKTFNSYADLVKTLLEAEGLNPGDEWYEEAYKELVEEEPKQVIFTKSGTYVVFYSNGTLAVSTWKWTDEAKGEARYSWDYSSIDNPNESGKINISFVGSQLLISEYINAEEEGVNVSVAIQYYLSEAK